MYLARFPCDAPPANRHQAADSVRREVEAARSRSLNARLPVPPTRGQGGAALQFEAEFASLGQPDRLRRRGAGSAQEANNRMRAFSGVLLSSPAIGILRADEQQAS